MCLCLFSGNGNTHRTQCWLAPLLIAGGGRWILHKMSIMHKHTLLVASSSRVLMMAIAPFSTYISFIMWIKLFRLVRYEGNGLGIKSCPVCKVLSASGVVRFTGQPRFLSGHLAILLIIFDRGLMLHRNQAFSIKFLANPYPYFEQAEKQSHSN